MLPNTHTDGRRRETSSVSIDVSDAEFHEFEKQIEDAIAFLEAEREQIRQLCDWPGVEGVELDFGIAWRDVVVQCDHLPAELVRLAGSLGLSLAISHYPVSDDSDDEPDTDDDADERPTSVTVP